MMARARRHFKYSLRQCKRARINNQADALAHNLAKHDSQSFWKENKFINNDKLPLPLTIGETSGAENIANMWRNHYKKLFNLVSSNPRNMLNHKEEFEENMIVTGGKIIGCIKDLRNNKAAGLDGLTAEHLKFCSDKVLIMLAMCITTMLIHGYLPQNMISSVIIPVIKDKCGKITCKDNYRPIAISSIFMKVLEKLLLTCMDD